jgi:hypothetical protein
VTAIVRALAMAVLLAILLAPRASPAQPADSRPSAAADAIGRAHFQRGQRLSASGNYAAAYREFAAGYAATKRPLFLFNMGEAARASGDVARARDSYLEFLRVDPRSALAATARTRLAELDRAAGVPSPRTEPPSRPEPAPQRATPSRATPPSATPPSATPPSATPPSPTPPSATPSNATPSSPTPPSATPPSATPPSATPRSAAPPSAAPPSSALTNRAPAITTAPGATRTEPLPLRPPSATPPQPARPVSDDSLPPERFTTSRESEDRPLWKKWPFWAVVGVGAIAGGAIVFAATRPDATACGVGCRELNFR